METSVLSISQIRGRQFVLSRLVPKMVGIAFDRGHDVYGYGGCSVHVTPDLLVSVSPIDSRRLLLSAYWHLKSALIKKVLSTHVTNAPDQVDPDFYRYCAGSVGLMSWKRGVWEDEVMGDSAAPASMTEPFPPHVLTGEGRALQ